MEVKMEVKVEVNSLRSWELKWTIAFLVRIVVSSSTKCLTSIFTSIFTSFYYFHFYSLLFRSLYFCSQGAESSFDVLVAAVNLSDVVDAAGAPSTHGCDEQGDTCADVGTCHASGMKLSLVVVPDDNGPVGIAEDNLCAHVDELVHEEQAAFEHFLMDEHGAFCLCADHEQDAQQVGRQSRPGRVADGHKRAVDEALYLVVFLFGNEEVLAVCLNADAEPAEGGGDDAKVLRGDLADADAVAHHGGHADKGTHLNHVWQDGMFCAVKRGDAFDGKEVASDAFDMCSHLAEHLAELLDVGFAGGIVDGCDAFGKHGRHDDVGGSGYGGFVQEHVGSFELFRFHVVEVLRFVVGEAGAKRLHSQEVRVEPSAAYLVAAGLCHESFASACQERSEHHHTAAQLLAALDVGVATEVLVVEAGGAERVVVRIMPCHFHTHVAEHLDLVAHVNDVGDVLDAYRLVGQQHGAQHLQRFVFRALRRNLALQPMPAFYDE